jgi:hypothetical protein
MENEHESMSLVALDDAQLDEVAGGCGGHGHHHGGWGGWGGWGARQAGGGAPEIELNLNINIITIAGNVFEAGDSNLLAVTAVNEG